MEHLIQNFFFKKHIPVHYQNIRTDYEKQNGLDHLAVRVSGKHFIADVGREVEGNGQQNVSFGFEK